MDLWASLKKTASSIRRSSLIGNSTIIDSTNSSTKSSDLETSSNLPESSGLQISTSCNDASNPSSVALSNTSSNLSIPPNDSPNNPVIWENLVGSSKENIIKKLEVADVNDLKSMLLAAYESHQKILPTNGFNESTSTTPISRSVVSDFTPNEVPEGRTKPIENVFYTSDNLPPSVSPKGSFYSSQPLDENGTTVSPPPPPPPPILAIPTVPKNTPGQLEASPHHRHGSNGSDYGNVAMQSTALSYPTSLASAAGSTKATVRFETTSSGHTRSSPNKYLTRSSEYRRLMNLSEAALVLELSSLPNSSLKKKSLRDKHEISMYIINHTFPSRDMQHHQAVSPNRSHAASHSPGAPGAQHSRHFSSSSSTPAGTSPGSGKYHARNKHQYIREDPEHGPEDGLPAPRGRSTLEIANAYALYTASIASPSTASPSAISSSAERGRAGRQVDHPTLTAGSPLRNTSPRHVAVPAPAPTPQAVNDKRRHLSQLMNQVQLSPAACAYNPTLMASRLNKSPEFQLASLLEKKRMGGSVSPHPRRSQSPGAHPSPQHHTPASRSSPPRHGRSVGYKSPRHSPTVGKVSSEKSHGSRSPSPGRHLREHSHASPSPSRVSPHRSPRSTSRSPTTSSRLRQAQARVSPTNHPVNPNPSLLHTVPVPTSAPATPLRLPLKMQMRLQQQGLFTPGNSMYASATSTSSNLNTAVLSPAPAGVERTWLNLHKPLLLRGEIFIRAGKHTRQVELKLLEDLGTLCYRDTDPTQLHLPKWIMLADIQELLVLNSHQANSFGLRTSTKFYEFYASAEDIVMKWLAALDAAVKRVLQSAEPVPVPLEEAPELIPEAEPIPVPEPVPVPPPVPVIAPEVLQAMRDPAYIDWVTNQRPVLQAGATFLRPGTHIKKIILKLSPDKLSLGYYDPAAAMVATANRTCYAMRIIPLLDIESLVLVASLGNSAFGIQTPKKLLEVIASSQAARDQWLHAIKVAVDQVHHPLHASILAAETRILAGEVEI